MTAIEEEIRRWIQQANDPQDKALLMIMYEIHSSLQENTRATEAIADAFKDHKTQFDQHIVEERDLFQQGRGLYRAMGWSLGVVSSLAAVVMALGIYILNSHININERQERDLQSHHDRITKLEEHRKTIDDMLFRRNGGQPGDQR